MNALKHVVKVGKLMLIRVVINEELRRKFNDNKIDKFIRKNSVQQVVSFHLQ